MGDFTPKTNWQDGDIPTADDMNRLEQAIYDGGGYSSLKTWADGNVPGVENWNRMEQGILDIGSDVVSKNLLINTQSMTQVYYQGEWSKTEDSEGFGVWGVVGYGTNSGVYMFGQSTDIADWAGKTVTFSVDVKSDGWAANPSYFRVNPAIMGGSAVTPSSAWRIKYYRVDTLNGSLLAGINADEWTRLVYTITWPATSEMDEATSTNFLYNRHGIGIQTRTANTSVSLSFRRPKIELADTNTDWSPAPEDIFTAKEWTNEATAENVINATAFNRWEQGIADMLSYREVYGMN